jgi:7-cyano-7-deazaguanine synthase
MKLLNNDVAVVSLSGGQDSATCLLWAMNHFKEVHTVSFNYGQRHEVELKCAALLAMRFAPSKDGNVYSHTVIQVPGLKTIGDSALVAGGDVTQQKDGLPASFVPGRNIILLAHAGALAYKKDAATVVTGVCETDYSGYPDCRRETIDALEVTLNKGMEVKMFIATPLMYLTKAETWKLAAQEHRDGETIIRDMTHTCYNGVRDALHEWGYGCGECPACILRKKGYEEYIAGK